MRLAVYTDYAYHRVGEQVYAERAFAIFLAELATRIDRMVVIGRLSPGSAAARYSLGDVDFVPLPFYPSLAEPLRAMGAMARSLAPPLARARRRRRRLGPGAPPDGAAALALRA